MDVILQQASQGLLFRKSSTGTHCELRSPLIWLPPVDHHPPLRNSVAHPRRFSDVDDGPDGSLLNLEERPGVPLEASATAPDETPIEALDEICREF